MNDPNKLIARLAGGVLLAFGGSLVGLLVFAIPRLFERGRLEKLTSVFGIGCFGLFACFCLMVGYRLAFDRPNRYQSILAPFAWYALTLLFVVFAFAAGIVSLRAAHDDGLVAVVSAALIAAACFKSGRRTGLHGTTVPGLPHDNARTPETASIIGLPNGWRIGTVGATTLYLHWSFPLGGLLVSTMTGFAFPAVIYYCLLFTLLTVLHECGHVIAAKAHGLQVDSVEISWLGGMCTIQAPRGVAEALMIFSAGLVVQIAVLLLTILYVLLVGQPTTALGKCTVTIFTFVNAIIIIVNIIPAKVQLGFANDGLVLWRLFTHVWKGQPFPFPTSDQTILFPPDTRLHLLEGFAGADFTTGIEFLNDATTPMEFVVAVLIQHLEIDREAAIELMLGIHRNGGVLVPIEGSVRSAAIAAAITSAALENGHALVCRDVNLVEATLARG
jgi:ATP-dependent Clp protease adapter protein ClpS